MVISLWSFKTNVFLFKIILLSLYYKLKKKIMSTIFPWIICFVAVVGLLVIALIVDYITKER